MTAYLLDTHALVWAVSEPAKLSAKARATIEDPLNELLVSAASAWEVAVQYRLGRFPAAEVLVRQFASILDTLGATEIAIRADHALRAAGFDWTHRDPFDRMLAAQALIDNVVLVTRDRVFRDLAGLEVCW